MGEVLYPEILKLWELEPYYSQHVMAMTVEKLHSKSDIAAQLAWRDQQLAAARVAMRDHGAAPVRG